MDTIDKKRKCFLIEFHSFIKLFKANGKKTITATTQRQKAKLTGGILSLSPRAMIKLPDQIAVAVTANKYPIKTCLFFILPFNLIPY